MEISKAITKSMIPILIQYDTDDRDYIAKTSLTRVFLFTEIR